MSPVATFTLLIVLIPALTICVKLANKKGYRGLGWIVGLLLGWIGVVVMLAVSKTHEQVVLDASHRLPIDQEAHALAAKSS